MLSTARPRTATLLAVALLCACGSHSAPRSTLYAPGGPVSAMDFVQAYNAYGLGQTYFKNGRYAEAIVEYEQSLKRYTRLDDSARALLREQYGLSQELIEGELALARTLARESTTTGEAHH
ncbi:MAG: hypothetical protein HYZ72_02705 [Deltaproteobacteria bacterium]|nr:hypothetical protein [Deltaproteobacteria bacterium]